MHSTFGLVTVIDGSNARLIFVCNNTLLANGSNTGVMDSCCCINATFVYVLMCYRYHESFLKNTMLQSSPRIRRHNIDAYNRMFQSLPLCFESMYYFHSGIMTYTKCFLGITVYFPKFSLGSGGKRAEKPTEMLHINIEMFVFWNLPRSIHITTLKPKLIESANRDNNGTSEGDPPLKQHLRRPDANFLYSCVLYTQNNVMGKNMYYIHINFINLFTYC